MLDTHNIIWQHIAERPELIPQLASWFQNEWGEFNPECTIQSRCLELIARKNSRELPLTMVATAKSELLGTYSLDLEDLAVRPNLSPWLANVFVNPKHRSQGIGTLLVNKALQQAQSLGILTFYLVTLDKARWYASMGWQVIEELSYRGKAVTIMRFAFGNADGKNG
jgi:GNAT superfamily N-acetyltransferase